jgi:hypothetical protein
MVEEDQQPAGSVALYVENSREVRVAGSIGVLVSVILCVVLTTTSVLAQNRGDANGWQTYTNARFGTTIEYPSAVFSVKEEPPTNGAGQRFRTPDGRAKLAVYDHFHQGQSPEEFMKQTLEIEGAVIDYVRVTKNFFAVSGVRRADVFYIRCNFPGGIYDCFEVEYPKREQRAWDAIVTRLSHSLRAGPGDERH